MQMKNFISIFEIPATDFSRAVDFYQAILGVSIEQVDMQGVQMGLLPGDDTTISGAVIKGTDYKPSKDGVIIYLTGGNDLQLVLDKVEANSGRILVPKTQISPEMGFYAMFLDTEGNRLGLHSIN
jgi:predicted enzyme related to lactoylglutathione lyase